MLQQTQVATVVDYFRRFVAALPTVRDLAAAEEDQVLALWQGLGYYRRARHLQAAARQIVSHHDGQVPREVSTLLDLSGVGRYTAGAIASIAHGVPAPILDGNVARVFARWFDLSDPVDAPATTQRLWATAADLVPRRRPGRFNEALMELGALVCTPRSPACPTCPMRSLCGAHRAGRAEALPRRLPRRAARKVSHHVVSMLHRGQAAFQRRGDDGLWARLWEMPTLESLAGRASAAALREAVSQRFGVAVTDLRRGRAFTHQTTHRTIRFQVWIADLEGRRPRVRGWRWRAPDAVDDLPLAVPQRRALAIVSEATGIPASAS